LPKHLFDLHIFLPPKSDTSFHITSACMISCAAKVILYQDTPVQPKVILLAT